MASEENVVCGEVAVHHWRLKVVEVLEASRNVQQYRALCVGRQSRVLLETLCERHGEVLHDNDRERQLGVFKVDANESDYVGVLELAVTETLLDETVVEVAEPRVLVVQQLPVQVLRCTSETTNTNIDS